MKKISDIILIIAAVLFALGMGANTFLANHDAQTNQRLGQAQQFLQQHVPQARNSLQTLALRVNQSAPQSPALKQALENLQLKIAANPSAAAPASPTSTQPTPAPAIAGVPTANNP